MVVAVGEAVVAEAIATAASPAALTAVVWLLLTVYLHRHTPCSDIDTHYLSSGGRAGWLVTARLLVQSLSVEASLSKTLTAADQLAVGLRC